MKPLKSALPLATWLLRIVFAAVIFMGNIKGVSPIDLGSINFYLSLAMLVFAVLLVVGGVLSKQTLAVLSALAIGLILIYRLAFPMPSLAALSTFEQLLLISVSFFYVCRGN